jgi:hypothetical protein
MIGITINGNTSNKVFLLSLPGCSSSRGVSRTLREDAHHEWFSI